MSDYAKFVRAVADNTRDAALDGLLEENRILQQANTELTETNTELREQNGRYQESILEFGVSLQEAQERNNELGARTAAMGERVNALMTETNVEFNKMERLLNKLDADLKAERAARMTDNELSSVMIDEQAKRNQRLRGLCVCFGLVTIGMLATRARK